MIISNINNSKRLLYHYFMYVYNVVIISTISLLIVVDVFEFVATNDGGFTDISIADNADET